MTSRPSGKGGGDAPLVGSVARAVAAAGSEVAFGLPGGGANLDLVGAAERAGLRFVLMHSETAACIAAAVHGHLVAAPGLALATRGPGATSAVNGAAAATLDRLPLLLVTDRVAAADPTTHQRIDQRALFRPVTKWSGTLGTADPDAVVAGALDVVAAGPPGAVHLDVDPTVPGDAPPAVDGAEPTGEHGLARAVELIGAGRRPVVLVGAAALADPDAVRDALQELAWPALSTYQASGIVPWTAPHHAGPFTNSAIERELVAGADLVLAVGLDPIEALPGPWPLHAPMVAFDPWLVPDRHPAPDVVVVGDLAAGLRHVVAAGRAGPAACPVLTDGRAGEQRRRLAAALEPRPGGSGFGPVEVVDALCRSAPTGTILTVDAGAHFLPLLPAWPAIDPRSVLISNGLATMGFAVPAAVGAALAHPGRPVVAVTGDGGLGMVLNELETLGRLGADVTVLVLNDAALSLIALKQRRGGASDAAVRYLPTDFAAAARAMGIAGDLATSTSDLERLLRTGWGRPRLVDARIDPSDYRRIFRALRG